jgi:hypothetical protein
MKTLNDYNKFEFIEDELVYLGESENFTYGKTYRIENDYDVSDDSEYRFYMVSLKNDNSLYERVPGNKLCKLSDFRNEKIENIIK